MEPFSWTHARAIMSPDAPPFCGMPSVLSQVGSAVMSSPVLLAQVSSSDRCFRLALEYTVSFAFPCERGRLHQIQFAMQLSLASRLDIRPTDLERLHGPFIDIEAVITLRSLGIKGNGVRPEYGVWGR